MYNVLEQLRCEIVVNPRTEMRVYRKRRRSKPLGQNKNTLKIDSTVGVFVFIRRLLMHITGDTFDINNLGTAVSPMICAPNPRKRKMKPSTRDERYFDVHSRNFRHYFDRSFALPREQRTKLRRCSLGKFRAGEFESGSRQGRAGEGSSPRKNMHRLSRFDLHLLLRNITACFDRFVGIILD